MVVVGFFFFKQKTAYELRISDWSSDVCSSDLAGVAPPDDTEYARPSSSVSLESLASTCPSTSINEYASSIGLAVSFKERALSSVTTVKPHPFNAASRAVAKSDASL